MRIVYGAETCSKCKVLVKEYEAKKIEFEYVDVATLTNEELVKVAAEANTTSLPIVIER